LDPKIAEIKKLTIKITTDVSRVTAAFWKKARKTKNSRASKFLNEENYNWH
jgi:hypothetical protein